MALKQLASIATAHAVGFVVGLVVQRGGNSCAPPVKFPLMEGMQVAAVAISVDDQYYIKELRSPESGPDAQ